MQSHPLDGDGVNPEIFKLLARVSKGQVTVTLPFRIPDTILYYNCASFWFHYDDTTCSLRRRSAKELEKSLIYKEFCKKHKSAPENPNHRIKRKCNIVAQFCSWRSASLDVVYLTKETLRDFLYAPRQDRYGILQKFIEPKSDHNDLYQIVWSPSMTFAVHKVNRRKVYDTSIDPALRCPTFDGPSHLTSEHYSTPHLTSLYADHCSRIVKHFESVEPSYTISRCVCYFKEDIHDTPWLLFSSCVRVVESDPELIKLRAAASIQPLTIGLTDTATSDAVDRVHWKNAHRKLGPPPRRLLYPFFTPAIDEDEELELRREQYEQRSQTSFASVSVGGRSPSPNTPSQRPHSSTSMSTANDAKPGNAKARGHSEAVMAYATAVDRKSHERNALSLDIERENAELEERLLQLQRDAASLVHVGSVDEQKPTQTRGKTNRKKTKMDDATEQATPTTRARSTSPIGTITSGCFSPPAPSSPVTQGQPQLQTSIGISGSGQGWSAHDENNASGGSGGKGMSGLSPRQSVSFRTTASLVMSGEHQHATQSPGQQYHRTNSIGGGNGGASSSVRSRSFAYLGGSLSRRHHHASSSHEQRAQRAVAQRLLQARLAAIRRRVEASEGVIRDAYQRFGKLISAQGSEFAHILSDEFYPVMETVRQRQLSGGVSASGAVLGWAGSTSHVASRLRDAANSSARHSAPLLTHSATERQYIEISLPACLVLYCERDVKDDWSVLHLLFPTLSSSSSSRDNGIGGRKDDDDVASASLTSSYLSPRSPLSSLNTSQIDASNNKTKGAGVSLCTMEHVLGIPESVQAVEKNKMTQQQQQQLRRQQGQSAKFVAAPGFYRVEVAQGTLNEPFPASSLFKLFPQKVLLAAEKSAKLHTERILPALLKRMRSEAWVMILHEIERRYRTYDESEDDDGNGEQQLDDFSASSVSGHHRQNRQFSPNTSVNKDHHRHSQQPKSGSSYSAASGVFSPTMRPQRGGSGGSRQQLLDQIRQGGVMLRPVGKRSSRVAGGTASPPPPRVRKETKADHQIEETAATETATIQREEGKEQSDVSDSTSQQQQDSSSCSSPIAPANTMVLSPEEHKDNAEIKTDEDDKKVVDPASPGNPRALTPLDEISPTRDQQRGDGDDEEEQRTRCDNAIPTPKEKTEDEKQEESALLHEEKVVEEKRDDAIPDVQEEKEKEKEEELPPWLVD